MAQKGIEFEIFVKAIYDEILKQDGYENVIVKHDVNIMGKSGQLHQVDIYWEFNIAGVSHKVAVECKEYKNTVSVGKIRDFYAALEDVGNINGIFVTTKGYQSGAIKYAEHKNISLKVVNEPSEADVLDHNGINTLNLNIHAHCISNVRVNPILDIDWVLENTEIKEGDAFSFNALNDEVKVIDSNYSLLGSFLDFENKLPREPENTSSLVHKYDFDDGYLHFPGSKYPPLKILAIEYSYDTYTMSSSSVTKFELMAEAVLKDIITGESYLFNKNVAQSYV